MTSRKVEFVSSFFGRNVGLKKSFQICLTLNGNSIKVSCLCTVQYFRSVWQLYYILYCNIFWFVIKQKDNPTFHFDRSWVYSRRPVPSTNQALPSCFYFRILWILMEQHCFYLFCPLGFLQGLRSLKHWLLKKLSMKNLDQKFKFLIKK